MEDFLGRYGGLMLFVKEIDEKRYQLICTVRPHLFSPVYPCSKARAEPKERRLTSLARQKAYFTTMSDLHRTEIQQLMSTLRGQIKKTSEDELEASEDTSPALRDPNRS